MFDCRMTPHSRIVLSIGLLIGKIQCHSHDLTGANLSAPNICTFYVQLTGPDFEFLGHYFCIHESIARKRIDSSNLGTDFMKSEWNSTCRIPEFLMRGSKPGSYSWKGFLELENADLRHLIIYINSSSPLSLSHSSASRIPSNSTAYSISCQMPAET
jgi:hypothetical protein